MEPDQDLPGRDDEDPQVSPAVAIAVAVVGVAVLAFVLFAGRGDDADPDAAPQQGAPASVMTPTSSTEPSPTGTVGYVTLEKAARKISPAYLTAVNTWGYDTNPDEYLDTVFAFVVDDPDQPETFGYLTQPMVDYCARTRCQHTVTKVSYLGTKPSGSDGTVVGEYRVTTRTTGTDGSSTKTSVWYVEVANAAEPKVVAVVDTGRATPIRD